LPWYHLKTDHFGIKQQSLLIHSDSHNNLRDIMTYLPATKVTVLTVRFM